MKKVRIGGPLAIPCHHSCPAGCHLLHVQNLLIFPSTFRATSSCQMKASMASIAPLAMLSVLLSLCSISHAANPSAVLLPVAKDGATLQYVTSIRQRTPLAPVSVVVDLGGSTLWVDCDNCFVSSSYRPVPCGSLVCKLARSATCETSCLGPRSPSCANNTCGVFPENTATGVSTAGNLIQDVLALATTFRPAPGPLAATPRFAFACGPAFLTRGLAAGATGMASLSRAALALPTQLAEAFRFSSKFAFCLPPSGSEGVVVFGDAPYVFQPGVDMSKSLTYTALLVNPVSTAGVSAKGDKSNEYFIGVKAIKVNGKAVPLNATLLAIAKNGVGGTKLSTVAPYTVLETSIYRAVTEAFVRETAMIPRVSPVAPFEVCYDGSKVGSTRVGPAVPQIELVLQSESVSWQVFGANSMVSAGGGGALCLGVLDGGGEPRTSIVIGGHMLEDNLVEFDLGKSRLGFSSSLLFLRTNCNNFNLG